MIITAILRSLLMLSYSMIKTTIITTILRLLLMLSLPIIQHDHLCQHHHLLRSLLNVDAIIQHDQHHHHHHHLEVIVDAIIYKQQNHHDQQHHHHHLHYPQVVLNTAPLGDEEVEIRPHSLSIHSYKTPTFCRWKPQNLENASF